MTKSEMIYLLIFIICFQSGINSQSIIGIGENSTIEISKGDNFMTFEATEEELNKGDILVFSTKPNDGYLKPGFIYASLNQVNPSPDNRDYASQKLGRNILYINKSELNGSKSIYFNFKSLTETNVLLEVSIIKELPLDEYPNIRHKLRISDISSDLLTFTNKNKVYKKVLLYALGENYNYFNMKVQYKEENIEAKQKFENGFGSIIDFTSDEFNDDENPKINIIIEPTIQQYYINRSVEIGYEIIDGEEKFIREVDIMEHIWGMADTKETCYNLNFNKNEYTNSIMLINSFTPGIHFQIKDANNAKLYSLDIFNNYFIRLPKSISEEGNYFCFKHTTPKTEENERFGEISFDFQIYLEDELSKYQMFIMPLINGKIYTHSLNKGDIMVYRHNYYNNNEDDKKILSANMLSIRGNPKLYGYTCEEYPDCEITTDILRNAEYIPSLNMYYINKRLNAEGNTEIKDEYVYELRKQYLTIVSCESNENDPNKGECKYTIEINNEKDEIQLIPETIFATSIISQNNYFLIRLGDYIKTTEYLKIQFTAFVGNAEMYIYTDKDYQNELEDYEFNHIHRKEIIIINKNLRENYYINIKCSEPAFIQLKYETNEHYKGYENLMPNEVSFIPLNQNDNSYYNVYNPHYYYPLDNEQRNNDFYYKVYTMDCIMGCASDPGQINYGMKEFGIEKEKNKLYSYLSSYGFAGRVQNFVYTSSENENCGLIMYNGEKSKNTPLLINSDMPHKSTFDNTYYVYPFIYDENNDQGVIIEFKIYDAEDSKEKDLYEYSYSFLGSGHSQSSKSDTIYKNTVIYVNKDDYQDNCKDNIFCTLKINIKKKYTNKNYYITTNVISAQISPEYIYSNQNYDFSLRPSSSKYFYSQIGKNSEGTIKFNNIPQNIEVYAKIVEKNKIEENYNWNKRVKLPEKEDTDLLKVENGIINYYINNTSKCKEGCELYIHIHSTQNENLIENDLISISFSLTQETNVIVPNYEENIEINPINPQVYILKSNEDIGDNKIIVIKISTKNSNKPAFLYASSESDVSLNKRDFSSQELGDNYLFLSTDLIKDGKNLYIYINSLEQTKATLQVNLVNEIQINQKSISKKIKLKLGDITPDLITYTHSTSKYQRMLIYALGENSNYFKMYIKHNNNRFEAKQMFDNGLGVIVDFGSDEFNDDKKVNIILEPTEEKYKDRKVEIWYDAIGCNDDILRQVNIMEHYYGMSDNKDEICYKIDSDLNEIKNKIMLINNYSPGINFVIRSSSSSEKLYSLDIFDNYFIRLPDTFKSGNYFCFRHTTPKEKDEKTDGEISFDFQIYSEDELSKYQMFIMPLINGKIYTHSLNRGDIMVYRHNYYNNNEGDKKILSANMLRIRGNPRLYGYTCNEYPNCQVTKDTLANLEKISPLNMYHINKKLNAEGNTEIKNEYVSELRKQYLTIVSCESDENDPNKGECKYTIEINNEKDEIQLIPETIFATSIISQNNYFLIRLGDYINTYSIEYLKIHFTVLTGNAEMYIYTDKEYKNEIKDYEFIHIHRKEIITIKKDFKENYYIIIKCSEPAFIQLKYETSQHYKGYNNLIPNEVNIEPLNKNNESYYNVYNPHYYYPLDNEQRNKDFYYEVISMDCSMNCGNEPGQNSYGVNNYNIYKKKNVLYSYLSTYGYHGKVDKFIHTSTENENCGLIIYNGEKSENTPLLINSDMPHKSNFETDYYIYPFIFDENNDQGLIIDFKIYNRDTEDSKKDDLYKISYGFIKNDKTDYSELTISNNITIFKEKSNYGDNCKDNILCKLSINIKKTYPEKKYYITINVIGSKISPEYIYSNQTYEFKLRPISSKYFYSSINSNSEGYIKFNNLPNNVKVYAKIVEKNKIEENYNWNKRVKLPENGDNDLLKVDKGIIKYDEKDTKKCNEGCELYFHIQSLKESSFLLSAETDIISISFTLKEEKYNEPKEDKDNDEYNYSWVIAVCVIVGLVLIAGIVVLIMKRRRVYSTDITQKDVNELSITLD